MIKKIISSLSIVAVIFGTIAYNPLVATAAQFTAVSDTMSTQAPNVTADHVVAWTQGAGHAMAVGDTTAIAFTVSGDFTANAAASWQTTDFSITTNVGTAAPAAAGASPSCSGSSAQNYIVTVSGTVLPIFTITTCTGWTTLTTGSAISFTIKGATGGTGTLTNRNGDVNNSTYTITNTGTNTDSATGAVVVETLDVVNITATVSPTLTFANDDATIGFGTLTSGAARWANGAGTGSASDIAANTFTIGTNAATGYTLTYNGATLTSGANTITPLTVANDADGTPGSSQFGLGVIVTGTGTATSGYDNTSVADWKFVASTTSQVASASGPVSSDTVAVHYLANIPASQQAGTYSTDLTWIVTGNF